MLKGTRIHLGTNKAHPDTKDHERARLQGHLQAFLERGGIVQLLPPPGTARPPASRCIDSEACDGT